MTLVPLAVVPRIKPFGAGRCDDWLDRLCHVYTVVVLIFFATVLSTVTWSGHRIKCWIPAELDTEDEHSNPFEDYIHNYCWIKNTYFIPFSQHLPQGVTGREEEEITYYQWVPLILLLQAFFFKFPHILWKLLHVTSGLNFHKLCRTAESSQCTSPSDSQDAIRALVYEIDKWIRHMRKVKFDRISNFRAKVCVVCNRRNGTYLTTLYLFVKLLYLVNVVGQIFLLNAFITTDKSMFGWEWLKSMNGQEKLVESQRFPRVTYCDFLIRQLQNVQRYTVQCVLPINLFNEKIFLILWFWFCMLALLTFFNTVKWVYLVFIRRHNVQFVKKYLKIYRQTLTSEQREMCKMFAEKFLRDDGCFVVRMLAQNTSDMVAMDVINQLFSDFCDRQKPNPDDQGNNLNGHGTDNDSGVLRNRGQNQETG